MENHQLSDSLWSFGLDSHGQLGHGDQLARIRPQQLLSQSLEGPWRQVACGSRMTIALTESGEIYGWGTNDACQLGTETLRLNQLEPIRLHSFPLRIKSVACRGSHVLALSSEGHVWSWGRADEGQLGHENHNSSFTSLPGRVTVLPVPISAIACGRAHSVAVCSSGNVYTWGCNEEGQLGKKSLTTSAVQFPLENLPAIKSVSCGSRHTLALGTDGSVWSWGWGFYGQLGHGDVSNRLSPKRLDAIVNGVSICCGYRHSFIATRSDVRSSSIDSPIITTNTSSSNVRVNLVNVLGFGWNHAGQLGFLNSSSSDSTVQSYPVNVLKEVALVAMAAGGRHSIISVKQQLQNAVSSPTTRARSETDPMLRQRQIQYVTYAFGRGVDGQLGTGNVVTSTSTPVRIDTFNNVCVQHIACGWSHSIVIASNTNAPITKKSLVKQQSVSQPYITLTLGDLDGFFGMLVQCVIQLMIIYQTLPTKCGIPTSVVTSRIIPAAAATIMIGNLSFAYQGIMLSRKEGGRTDVTAQPQGINTVLIFAYMLLVMAPEYEITNDPMKAWEAGVFAAYMTGLCQILCLPLVNALKNSIPRAALFSSTAGIALTFLSMGFAFQVWQNPSIAIGPLMLVVICYGSGVKLPLRIPVGLGALFLGTSLAFILYYADLPTYFIPFTQEYSFKIQNILRPEFTVSYNALTSGAGYKYMSIILPMVLVNLMGNLANLENAASVGDEFSTTYSVLIDSCVTIIGALLGCPFPTGIYIGQPVYKAMGAKTGYLVLNAIAIALIAIINATSLLLDTVPVASIVGFLLWVGLMITAKSFEQDPASKSSHSIAVCLGLIPCLAAWAWQLVLGTITASSKAAGTTISLSTVIDILSTDGVNPGGMIALSQGYLITAIILSSTLVHVIDRDFFIASVWMLIAAVLSALGVIHSFSIRNNTIVSDFGIFPGGTNGFAVQYFFVYTGVAVMLLLFHLREVEVPLKRAVAQSIKTLRMKFRKG